MQESKYMMIYQYFQINKDIENLEKQVEFIFGDKVDQYVIQFMMEWMVKDMKIEVVIEFMRRFNTIDHKYIEDNIDKIILTKEQTEYLYQQSSSLYTKTMIQQ